MRIHCKHLLLAASALTLSAGVVFAGDIETGVNAGVTGEVGLDVHGNVVHVDVGTDADADGGVVIIPRSQPEVPAALTAWTPDDLVGASVVNETGMRIATVDGVAADASGSVNLILAIDAQPGAKRAVPFERFDLGTSGGALLLVGATDAELLAMADYDAAAGAYTPIISDAELQAHLATAAGN